MYRTVPPASSFPADKQTAELPATTVFHVLHSHVYITCCNRAVVCSSSMLAANLFMYSAAETLLKRCKVEQTCSSAKTRLYGISDIQ